MLFKNKDLDPDLTECTLDITNLPLAQFYCSDLDDPFNAYGYGVNAKNLHCGFASWFNCAEDLEALGGENLFQHTGDLNFDILPCATHTPTFSPVKPTPVPTPVPTSEECKTTENKCKFYLNDDGTNFCSDESTCPPGMIWESANNGQGCSDDNDANCGCCRVPNQCTITENECKFFENDDGTNFCSDEATCPPGMIWDSANNGQGCSDGSSGNDGNCGCCIVPSTPTPPPSSVNEPCDCCVWRNVSEGFCEEVDGEFFDLS
uniref:Uncharacterized protein n=1 Tax=Aplanochytrium stocchinoi TaxID=215587 RepID=A0A7S3UYL4_9STRA